MYFGGQGVPQSDSDAIRWFRLATEQGLVVGQANLGRMYFNSKETSQENVVADKRLNLAAAQGDELARELREVVGSLMSAPEIAEAQRLAREWLVGRE